jgi:hypothetical protein
MLLLPLAACLRYAGSSSFRSQGKAISAEQQRGGVVLANLLPGLRDLRGPLAVGYMWLLVLWLFFADNVPRERPNDDGAFAKLFDLGELLGPAVILGAVSFAAYMIGSFLFLDTQGYILASVREIFSLVPSGLGRRAERNRYELTEWAFSHGIPENYVDDLLRGREVRRLEAKLRVANVDIYGDFDRLKAEGELRLNVAPAIAALAIALTLELSWWYALGVIFAVLLTWQGFQRLEAGREVIFQALMADIITVKIQGADRDI